MFHQKILSCVFCFKENLVEDLLYNTLKMKGVKACNNYFVPSHEPANFFLKRHKKRHTMKCTKCLFTSCSYESQKIIKSRQNKTKVGASI